MRASAHTSLILNKRIRIRYTIKNRVRVKVRVKNRARVGMVFRIRVRFNLSKLRRATGGNLSKEYDFEVDICHKGNS